MLLYTLRRPMIRLPLWCTFVWRHDNLRTQDGQRKMDPQIIWKISVHILYRRMNVVPHVLTLHVCWSFLILYTAALLGLHEHAAVVYWHWCNDVRSWAKTITAWQWEMLLGRPVLTCVTSSGATLSLMHDPSTSRILCDIPDKTIWHDAEVMHHSWVSHDADICQWI